MKRELIILTMILISLASFSQEKSSYEFKTTTVVNKKSRSATEKDFYFVSFNIKYIKTPEQRNTLINKLESDSNFKQVKINTGNEFHGFIHNTLDAHKVREILLSYGVDFEFDKYKFKGCYMNEQLKQEIKK